MICYRCGRELYWDQNGRGILRDADDCSTLCPALPALPRSKHWSIEQRNRWLQSRTNTIALREELRT